MLHRNIERFNVKLKMRFKLLFLLVFMGLLQVMLPQPAMAAFLKADQIRALLIHKTVTWNHNGTTQHQFFDSTGLTIFEDSNGDHEKGVWTVTDDNMFCSNWKQRGWLCYRLEMMAQNQLRWEGPINSNYAPKVNDEAILSRLQLGNKTSYNIPMQMYRPKIFGVASRVLTGEFVLGATDMVQKNVEID